MLGKEHPVISISATKTTRKGQTPALSSVKPVETFGASLLKMIVLPMMLRVRPAKEGRRRRRKAQRGTPYPGDDALQQS